MKNVLMLARREVWENRSLWIAPLTLAAVILILSMFGGVHVGDGATFRILGDDMRHQGMAELAPAPEAVRTGIIAGVLVSLTMVQLMVLGIVVFFYLLDCLLSERRDRSILFWKSLPVSDAEVVTSKALTALVGAPLFVLAVSAVMQPLFSGIAALRLGDVPFAIWDTVVWLKVQLVSLGFVTMVIMWYLPIAGYLMVVSVWARKNAFLWAVLPWVGILVIEGLILRSHYFGNFLADRFGGFVKVMALRPDGDFDGSNLVGEPFAYMGRVFMDWKIWVGAAAGIALMVAASRIRRYRDDS